MERDYGKEIDEIKEELRSIRRFIIRQVAAESTAAETSPGDVLSGEGRARLQSLQDELMAYADRSHSPGAVAYTGTFASGDGDSTRQSIWQGAVDAKDLLALNDNRLVERVLSSVGSGPRLAILLALLQQPLTAAQLVETLGANTTGQVYHHLKPLLLADIIYEEKGAYIVKPHRVQGLIMLLAGVRDLVDEKYTKGEWQNE